jgi:hypothetical protein
MWHLDGQRRSRYHKVCVLALSGGQRADKLGTWRFVSGHFYGDVDGNGFADFVIRVAGLTKMSASDLLL